MRKAAKLLDELKGGGNLQDLDQLSSRMARARTVGELDDLRIELNRLDSKYEARPEAAQYQSPLFQESLKSAADAIRNALYPEIAQRYKGLVSEERLRSLQKTHGAAIQADQLMQNTANAISRAASEEAAPAGIVQRIRGSAYRATMRPKHAVGGLIEKLWPASDVELFNTRMRRVIKGAVAGEGAQLPQGPPPYQRALPPAPIIAPPSPEFGAVAGSQPTGPSIPAFPSAPQPPLEYGGSVMGVPAMEPIRTGSRLLGTGRQPQPERGTVPSPPIGPIIPKQEGSKIYLGKGNKPLKVKPVLVTAGSEPTPTGGARGYGSKPLPPMKYAGEVKGVPAEIPEGGTRIIRAEGKPVSVTPDDVRAYVRSKTGVEQMRIQTPDGEVIDLGGGGPEDERIREHKLSPKLATEVFGKDFKPKPGETVGQAIDRHVASVAERPVPPPPQVAPPEPAPGAFPAPPAPGEVPSLPVLMPEIKLEDFPSTISKQKERGHFETASLLEAVYRERRIAAGKSPTGVERRGAIATPPAPPEPREAFLARRMEELSKEYRELAQNRNLNPQQEARINAIRAEMRPLLDERYGLEETREGEAKKATEPKKASPAPPPPVEPKPEATPEPPKPAEEPKPVETPAILGPVVEMDPNEIQADPRRFQFRTRLSQVMRAAINSGTAKYSKELSEGPITAWKDPADGKLYVVDGHHRLEIAKRSGTKSIEVRELSAPTMKAARAFGAYRNIASGHAEAIDVAKFMRDMGVSADDFAQRGVALGSRLVSDGSKLANLDDPIFEKVVSGQMPESVGAAIGSLADKGKQAALAKLIAAQKGRSLSPELVGILARRAQNAEEIETQDLFGTQSESNVLEAAKVEEYIRGRLAMDKRLFGYVAKGARPEELSRGGNIIDVYESRKIADSSKRALDVFDKLIERKGPINDAINAAAEAIKSGESEQAVRDRTYGVIHDAVAAELGAPK
jgi:ParB-like chromosome segregation protein Spo0J